MRWKVMLGYLLIITPWECTTITNKNPSPYQEGGSVRNFRHIPGPVAEIMENWEAGLREAVLQSLLRERHRDASLRDRLRAAPLIGRRDAAPAFGDVVVMARGQLYATGAGQLVFVQDRNRNDCDDCYNARRCDRHQCQAWTPKHQEQLLVLWTVKRLRHRNVNGDSRYEIEYTVSPLNEATRDIVIRKGRFNYAIPGHIFVIKSGEKSTDNGYNREIYNRKIPHNHYLPTIPIGYDSTGQQHILHSYPGFFTSNAAEPSHQKVPVTNDPKEIELYKKLIETLASKTSTTVKTEEERGPLNHYGVTTETTKPTKKYQVATKKPAYSKPTKPQTLVPVRGGTTFIQTMTSRVDLTSTTAASKPHIGFTITSSVEPQTTSGSTTSTTSPKQQIAAHSTFATTTSTLKPQTIASHVSSTLSTSTSTPKPHTIAPHVISTTTTSTLKPQTIGLDISSATTNSKPQITTSSTTTTSKTKPQMTFHTSSFKPPTISQSTTTSSTFKPQTTSHITSTETPSTFKPQTISQSTTISSTLKPQTISQFTTTSSTFKPQTISQSSTTSSTIKPQTISQSSTTSSTFKPQTTSHITSTAPSSTFKPQTTSHITSTAPSSTFKPQTISQSSTTSRTFKPQTISQSSTTSSTFKPQTSPNTPETTFGITSTTTKPQTTPSHIISSTTKSTFKPQTTSHLTPTTATKTTSHTTFTTITTTPKPETTPHITFATSTSTVKLETTPSYTSSTMKQSANSLETQSMASTTASTMASQNESTTIPLLSIPTETSMTESVVPNQMTSTTMLSTTESTSTSGMATEIKPTMIFTTTNVAPPSTTAMPMTHVNTTESTSVEIEKATEPTNQMPAPSVEVQTTPFGDITSTTQQTTSIVPKTTTASDFLTDVESIQDPINTLPVKKDYDLDDIFGSTMATTRPASTTFAPVTESDLAMQLFGNKNFRNAKVIFSGFYEASTTTLPQQSVDSEPITSQSFETSVSYQVNERTGSRPTKKPRTTTMLGVFDDLAVRLVNHARSIDYVSKKVSRPTSARYKKRTYSSRTRKATRKKIRVS